MGHRTGSRTYALHSHVVRVMYGGVYSVILYVYMAIYGLLGGWKRK